jgi:hypothetical protein
VAFSATFKFPYKAQWKVLLDTSHCAHLEIGLAYQILQRIFHNGLLHIMQKVFLSVFGGMFTARVADPGFLQSGYLRF